MGRHKISPKVDLLTKVYLQEGVPNQRVYVFYPPEEEEGYTFIGYINTFSQGDVYNVELTNEQLVDGEKTASAWLPNPAYRGLPFKIGALALFQRD